MGSDNDDAVRYDFEKGSIYIVFFIGMAFAGIIALALYRRGLATGAFRIALDHPDANAPESERDVEAATDEAAHKKAEEDAAAAATIKSADSSGVAQNSQREDDDSKKHHHHHHHHHNKESEQNHVEKQVSHEEMMAAAAAKRAAAQKEEEQRKADAAEQEREEAEKAAAAAAAPVPEVVAPRAQTIVEFGQLSDSEGEDEKRPAVAIEEEHHVSDSD